MVVCSIFRFIVKYSLFTLNLILTISGLALAVAGIVVYLKLKDLLATKDANLENFFQWVAVAVIVLGMIIFFISLSGCWGSAAENKCLLTTYAVILVILVAPKIFLATKYDDYSEKFEGQVNKNLIKIYEKQETDVTFHLVELGLHCCGTTGPESYPNIIIPKTCCEKKITNLEDAVTIFKKYKALYAKMSSLSEKHMESFVKDIGYCTLNDANTKGCSKEAYVFIDYYMSTNKTVLIVIISVEIFGFLASVYLCTLKKQNQDKKGYY